MGEASLKGDDHKTLAHASLVPSLDDSQIPESDLSIHEQVKKYYGEILSSSDDLKTNACCCSEDRPPKYVLDVMPHIADEIIERFYGCGSPIPPALEGKVVLDLGCGVGRDVYVLSKLVGESGRVIGVDMTESQLKVAKAHQARQAEVFGHEKSNVEFLQGYIEDLASLGIEDDSIDLVVSNCVINLTPFKEQVLKEVYRVLKPGGELYFSDVFCDRRMPKELIEDPVLRGECLGGAIYIEDFRRMMSDIGWKSFLYTSIDDIHVSDLALETKLGFTSFTSRTVRAIKADNLEDGHEDYGQTATYLGTMPEMPRYFDLTNDIRMIKGRKCAISSNMAEMISQSRYGSHFQISSKKGHRGSFDFRMAQDAIDVKGKKRSIDLDYLNECISRIGASTFEERVDAPSVLTAPNSLTTMQVNITYQCNLACRHCYLECSMKNNEAMSKETMQECLNAFSSSDMSIMDITGGSPELHPDFEWFLRESSKIARDKGGYVIVRSNLTLEEDPDYERMLDLFADTKAHLVASLPYYNSEASDAQRGRGVFEKVVNSVRRLNALGYGTSGADEPLSLDLVYNVSGPFLPPPQDLLEDLYKSELSRREGINFDNLYAFNNYPLGRFGQDLLDSNLFDEYMKLLVDNFNALAVQRMMCRDQVNVDVDGRLYDCEVNHVLKMPVQIKMENGDLRDATINDIASGALGQREIRTHPVCYSCSAGSGSSCSGSLVKEYEQ